MDKYDPEREINVEFPARVTRWIEATGERLLQDADAAAFSVVDEREFKDKNHRYSSGSAT